MERKKKWFTYFVSKICNKQKLRVCYKSNNKSLIWYVQPVLTCTSHFILFHCLWNWIVFLFHSIFLIFSLYRSFSFVQNVRLFLCFLYVNLFLCSNVWRVNARQCFQLNARFDWFSTITRNKKKRKKTTTCPKWIMKEIPKRWYWLVIAEEDIFDKWFSSFSFHLEFCWTGNSYLILQHYVFFFS